MMREGRGQAEGKVEVASIFAALGDLLALLVLRLVHALVALGGLFILKYRRFKAALTVSPASTLEEDSCNLSLLRGVSVPKHLVVQVTKHWPKSSLPLLACWSLKAGIKHFSYYDPTGVIEDEDDFMLSIEKSKSHIPGHVYRRRLRGKNGYSRSIGVEFIRRKDCKEKVIAVMRDLIDDVKNNVLKADDVDADRLDERLSGTPGEAAPDPDLSIYCGEMCRTDGLLPWHIKLTEFMSFGDPSEVSEENFYRILREFSKCEQRYGK